MDLFEDDSTDTHYNRIRYIIPEINVIEIKSRNVLCQSTGNDSMREFDFVDGDFGEV